MVAKQDKKLFIFLKLNVWLSNSSKKFKTEKPQRQ